MDNKNDSFIRRYGDFFTEKKYVTNPAIGREEEIKQLCLTLLTPDKSAILTGKPGIGKTAIVEGLAYKIEQNDVPMALAGYTIVKIDTQSLIGIDQESGDTRIQKLISEIKNQKKFILFIDEIHTLINQNSDSGLDFANMFKTGLGRGDIKVIGATTTDEYNRYILRDKAFTRRFQKIEVAEPTQEQTVKILLGSVKKIEASTSAKLAYTPFVQERIMKFIVNITTEYNRIISMASRYPDVSLALLANAFSEAVFDNKKIVTIEHVRKAIENSKVLYPDVIKKGLIKFDTEFKDLLDQEKELKKDFQESKYDE